MFSSVAIIDVDDVPLGWGKKEKWILFFLIYRYIICIIVMYIMFFIFNCCIKIIDEKIKN